MDRSEEIDDDAELESQVYMACVMQGQRIGVSYYDASIDQLHVLEIWDNGTGGYPLIDLVKYQAKPSIIYASTKIDESLLLALKKNENDCPVEVKLVKSSIFSYEQASHRLLYLRVAGMDECLGIKERSYYLHSLMNMASDVLVRAAGGLLAILGHEGLLDSGDQQEHRNKSISIGGLSEISLNGFLIVDAAAHEALQIFQADKHPSYMGIGKAKEGFSVYGILNKCVTSMGRCLMRAWFMRPILDLDILNDRLATISFFHCCDEIVTVLREALKGVKDVCRLLKKFNSPSSVSTEEDWSAFMKSISSLLDIRRILEIGTAECLQEHMEYASIRILGKACSSITEELAYVLELVIGVIDTAQSKEKGYRTLVRHGFCEELDELRLVYDELPDFLEKVSSLESERLPLKEGNKHAPAVVYVHQIGYLLCIFENKLYDAALEYLGDIEFAFADENADEKKYFYRTSKTRELDLVLGDIYHKILDMERAICRDLISQIEHFSDQIRSAMIFSAELDCFLSLVLVAKQQNLVRPFLTEESLIYIHNGRHMLQEMTVETFVPNDTTIASNGLINIITGPNYSGKSIYIKQVAVIVFLAHIGSFVPAEAAKIGLTDRIYCAMGSKAMSSQHSTFMIDLHQVGMMLRNATSRSLCLLDEFGKGTLTEDGIGLLSGAIQHFDNQEHTPKVLICTHLTEIFNESCLPKSDKITFYTMSVLHPQSSDKLEGEIVFLYRLIPGQTLLSYGLYCAQMAGIPDEVLQRANFILSATTDNEIPIGRIRSKELSTKDNEFKEIVEKLLVFDVAKGDLSVFFSQILEPKTSAQKE